MKKLMILVFCCWVLGCSHTMGSYIDDPKTLLEDPVSVEHQKALDELESAYLNKEMTYSEYLTKKNALEDGYSQKVQKRKEIIESYRTDEIVR